MKTLPRLWLPALLTALCACDREVSFTLVQLNDVYEMEAQNGGKSGGLDRVATLLKQLKKRQPHTYAVLAGDLLSPSAIGVAQVDGEPLAGKQMIDIFNRLPWDYATFGNHEFDIGHKALLQRLQEARFSFFSSNVLDNTTGEPFAHTQRTVIFDVDGVKVGLAGITTPDLHRNFVRILDPFDSAKQALRELEAQHADIVVLVTHQSLADDIRFAEQLPGVDLIIGGHEHENWRVFRGPNGTPITKTDANARSAYIHDISYDRGTHRARIDSRLEFITDALPSDPEVGAAIRRWLDNAFKAYREQGFDPHRVICNSTEALDGLESSVRHGGTRLTELLAASYLHVFPEAELSLYNAGSIRIDDSIPAGLISEYDVLKILPFGGAVKLVEMPGETLARALDAGLRAQGKGAFLHYANVARQQRQWLIGGKPLNPERSYKVAIADFLIETGDAGLEFLQMRLSPGIKLMSAPPVDTRKALIDELRRAYPAH
jgi:5'-nucleotidase